jgi:hypothetical protein
MGEKRIRNSKTLQIATDTFLDLFTLQQRSVLEAEVNKDEFFALVDEKNKLPLNKLVSDTDRGIAVALIESFNKENKGKIK